MEELSAEELQCLRTLAGPPRLPFAPCSPKLLERLCRRGLVLTQPAQWWPLGNPYSHYFLSPTGRRLLAQQG